MAQFALNAGAGGFVVKSDAERELLTAVEAVMLGKQYVSRKLADLVFAGKRDTQTSDPFHRKDITPPLLRQDRESSRSHEVLFYPDESFFLDSFGLFMRDALEANEAVIVVATQPHRDNLSQRLQAQGVDVCSAVESGRYISLDVAEKLSRFMVNDMPDPGKFLEVASDLVMKAAKQANGELLRVSACGECAPLLWGEGKGDAAVRLEQLWNEIGKTYGVNILCGYPQSGFHREENSHVYQRICAEHSALYSG